MSCLSSRGADEDLASETDRDALNSILTANLMLRFRDFVITSDAGLLQAGSRACFDDHGQRGVSRGAL